MARGSDYKISISKSSSSLVCPLLLPPSVPPSLRPSLALQAVSQLTAVQPVLGLFASIIPELLVRVGVFTPRPELSFDPRCPCQSFTLRSCAGCYIIPPSSRSGSLGPSARCGPPRTDSINTSPPLLAPASPSFNLDRLRSLASHTSRSARPPLWSLSLESSRSNFGNSLLVLSKAHRSTNQSFSAHHM